MKTFYTFILCLLLAGAANAQTGLGLKLEKGKQYKLKTESKMKITQDIMGQEMVIDIALTGNMTYLVKAVNPTSYDMDVWYENMTMEMAMPQATMKFSSESPAASDMFSQVLAAMVKKPFQAQLSKTGKVNSVQNIDKLFAAAFEKFPNISEAEKAQVIGQLSQSYGDKAFASNIEMITAIFPEKAVKKGDTWNVKTQLQGGMKADISTTYSLVEDGQGFRKIHGDSKITATPGDEYTVSNGMEMKFKLNGTMVSDIKVDKNTGWVIEAKITQDVSGESQIKGNDQMPQGMTIPLSFTTATTNTGSVN